MPARVCLLQSRANYSDQKATLSLVKPVTENSACVTHSSQTTAWDTEQYWQSANSHYFAILSCRDDPFKELILAVISNNFLGFYIFKRTVTDLQQFPCGVISLVLKLGKIIKWSTLRLQNSEQNCLGKLLFFFFFLKSLEEIALSYTQLIGQNHHQILSYLKRRVKWQRLTIFLTGKESEISSLIFLCSTI